MGMSVEEKERPLPNSNVNEAVEEEIKVVFEGVGGEKTTEPKKLKVLSNVLMLAVCVCDYDDESTKNLRGTKKDREHIELIAKRFGWDLVTLKTDECTLFNFENVLEKTRALFKKAEFAYEALVVVFSGHGTADSIKLSDGKFFSRDKLLSFFNGLQSHCPNKIEALKMFIIDACRGWCEAAAIDFNVDDDEEEKEAVSAKDSTNSRRKKSRQPNYNRFVLRSGTKPYVAFDNVKTGGYLINAFYEAMLRVDVDGSHSFADIVAMVQEVNGTRVPDTESTVLIEVECTMLIRVMNSIALGAKKRTKENRERIKNLNAANELSVLDKFNILFL